MLVQDPELVLGDEPVAALDPARAAEALALLTALVRGRGRTLVVSLHDLDLALQHCDRVVALREGRVVLDVPADSLTAADARDVSGKRTPR